MVLWLVTSRDWEVLFIEVFWFCDAYIVKQTLQL